MTEGKCRMAEWQVALAIIIAVGALQCCTTVEGEKKFDQCQALKIAQGSHAVADGASLVVCSSIADLNKRAKCMEERARYRDIGNVILQLGSAVIRACSPELR